MDDVLGYEGKHAVVTGGASGMGRATAEVLLGLGAAVTVLDVNDIELAGVRSIQVDLRDKASVDRASASIAAPVHAYFNVAGLPGPPFSDLDVMLVNFVGGRELFEQTVTKMPEYSAIAYVASAAGMGWQPGFANWLGLLQTNGFDEGKAWCEANPDAYSWSAYASSKQVINAWTAWRSNSLMRDHRIRLNCTNPGPTTTAMMPFFHEANGKELVDAALGPVGRYSTAEEQAWPLVALNSPRFSYVIGETLFTDGGFYGAIQTDQLDLSGLTSEA